MAKPSRTFGKKATKATVRHTVRGFSSKAKRKPLRSATLLTAGAVVGAIVGWFAARRAAGPPTKLSPPVGGQLRPPDAPA
jgi:F0F1-type ATP synthase assembly protein I